MDQSDTPSWFRQHRWWIQLTLDTLAVAGTIAGCVVPFVL